MGYFPFFVDLDGQEGLVVGGGAVALRKVEKLLPYGPRLSAAAPEFLPAMEDIPGLTLIQSPFEEGLLEGKAFVVAATDDPALNRRISTLCRERRILVNVADDRSACAFLFPALVKRGDLSIGISTSGASPTAAVYLKELIAGLLPENFAGLLAYLDGLRDEAKAVLPEESDRAAFFSSVFSACMQKGGSPLSRGELEQLLLDFTEQRRA